MTPEEKKEAKRIYDIEYRRLNKEKIKKQKEEWYKKNPDKVKESVERNKESKKISNKKYATKNKNKLNIIKRKWAKDNPEKNTKSKSKYVKKMMINDELYKLKHYLRTSINNSIKKNGYIKKSKTHEILGCSYEEFKIYLESKFESWMRWDNRGNWDGIPSKPNTAWDIDHIIPISKAKTEEDVIRLNHYSNLQPLCSYYNRYIKKNN
jgi:hypothetical protein